MTPTPSPPKLEVESTVIPPPSTLVVQHDHKVVLYLPDGRALVRKAGF